MPRVLAISGRSGAGKTGLLERLVDELAGRGWRVGCLKHASHGFDLDVSGKDSMRLREAGASPVGVLSGERLFMVEELEEAPDLADLAQRYFQDAHIVLAEGFKSSGAPKVEVLAEGKGPLLGAKDRVVARVGGGGEDGLPGFDRDDIVGIASFLEERYLKGEKKKGLFVCLDGKPLGMKGFVREFVKNGILGMLGSLRGFKSPKRITITIYPERSER